jgi:hypothetical protein
MLHLPYGSDERAFGDRRRERCRLFNSYLECLQADFCQATLALKVMMLQSRRDRPDLAAALLHHQLTFGCRLVWVRTRLFLYRWGIGSVDVSRLVGVFNAVARELRAALPVGLAA